MFFSIKKFLDFSPIIEINELSNIDLKRIFQKNGFFIIKNFYDYKKQNYYLDIINKTLEIEKNHNTPKVLSDALNHNSNFLDIVFDKNLNFINTKILDKDYIFLQNLDLHANQNAHQWHRDLSTKDGKVLESNKKDFLIIKYALYLKVSSSAFFIIKNSHKSSVSSEVFGKDLYNMKEYNFFNIKNFHKAKTGDIVFYRPNPGDLIGFDYRILHSASNINNNEIPSEELGQKEKKVIWPTFGKRNSYTESIYQYVRHIRKDFAISSLKNKNTYSFLKSKNHLPETYEVISKDHIDWSKKNLMYGAEHDLCIYDDDNTSATINNRLKFIDNFKKDSKYELLQKKQMELIKKYK
jgi:ectoine hydroxylase-related dioxygenase (phytanoyl-CoA dioxygenase family)